MIGYDDVISGLSPENKLDEGAGDETSGAVPTASSDGIETPDRQSGEGPAGSSPDLPADLIDRAVEAAAEWTSWYNGNGWDGLDEAEPEELEKYLDLARGPAEAAVKAVAPLLVEHGRQQEREKWEARIENEAEWCGSAGGDRYTGREVARLLRSLLTGEGDGE